MPYQDYTYNPNSVTTNGASLSGAQTGVNQTLTGNNMSNIGNGSNLSATNVTANGVNSLNNTTSGSFFKNSDGSFNTNNIGMVIGGIQTLGSLWNSYQQNKIAKEQIALQRQAFQTNLRNNTQTYNTALEDRIRARYNTEGRTSGETEAYLNKNRL